MESAVALGGLAVAMVSSWLSFLTVRRGQRLDARRQDWEAGQSDYERQTQVIEEALAACDDLVQHVHLVEQYWWREPHAELGVAEGLGPGVLRKSYETVHQQLQTDEIYGIDVEGFFRSRHRLLLWSQRVRETELREGLVRFHDECRGILSFETIEEGRKVRKDLYHQYLELMARAGQVVDRHGQEAVWSSGGNASDA